MSVATTRCNFLWLVSVGSHPPQKQRFAFGNTLNIPPSWALSLLLWVRHAMHLLETIWTYPIGNRMKPYATCKCLNGIEFFLSFFFVQANMPVYNWHACISCPGLNFGGGLDQRCMQPFLFLAYLRNIALLASVFLGRSGSHFSSFPSSLLHVLTSGGWFVGHVASLNISEIIVFA